MDRRGFLTRLGAVLAAGAATTVPQRPVIQRREDALEEWKKSQISEPVGIVQNIHDDGSVDVVIMVKTRCQVKPEAQSLGHLLRVQEIEDLGVDGELVT